MIILEVILIFFVLMLLGYLIIVGAYLVFVNVIREKIMKEYNNEIK